ncbi:MAG: PfkB family carbohydrate kinase [Candidatus Hodarchaeota archaeon]
MKPQRNKVIVLGSIAYDYIMNFSENFVNAVSMNRETGEFQSTVTASSRIQHYGGTAGNISYNLGLLKFANAHLICAVGKDFESLGYRNHISKFKNIEIGVEVHEDLFTAACYIVNDVNVNQMIIFHGGALDKCEDINLREKIKDPNDYSYAINSTQSVNAMMNFADQLYELKIPAIFDPGQVTPLFTKDVLIKAIRKSNILIGNAFEIQQIKDKTEMTEEELIKNVDAIIITKGGDGSELIYKDKLENVNRINIPICNPKIFVDSTGAGDGYRAGFLAGLMLGMPLIDSCRLGSVVGCFVVETTGAQTQFYTIEDIQKQFLDSFGYVPSELEAI